MGMILNYLRVSTNQFEKFMNDSQLLEDYFLDEDTMESDNLIDIDKSWDGLHYLITGNNLENTENELSKVFFNNNLIDIEQDFGYGPASYLNIEEVKILNSKISKLSFDDLKNNFNSDEMNKLKLYPSIWNEEKDALEYLLEYFEELKIFFNKAYMENQIIIRILC